jgi:RNA polymerase sigma factor (TIGR02999 family)
LTLLLKRMQSGEAGAEDVLASAVYNDLLAMARSHFRRDFGSAQAGHTLQPTMLANDTLMKLIRQRGEFDNSGHFFAIASRLMMRVLLDYYRARTAQKRGRAEIHVPLDPIRDEIKGDARLGGSDDAESGIDVEAFNIALGRLSELDPRKADVVRYRILWGLTLAEISQTLEIATSTADRDWTFAQAWLSKELRTASPDH